VEIGARLFVPVVQPAFIQLLKNLLFLLFEIWVVVLGHTTISFHDSTFAGYLWQGSVAYLALRHVQELESFVGRGI
jgi:hypothetical protein